MEKLNKKDVSGSYSTACNFMHIHTNNLYESLHTDSGEAITDQDEINIAIKEFRYFMSLELDMIRCASSEVSDDQQS
jgi:hypothetical protein